MMKFIGLTGLTYLWSKIKSVFATKDEIDTQLNEIVDIIEENEEVVASALNDLNSRLDNMVVEETDPTVPDWAKQEYPPSYADTGALSAYSYVDGVGFNNGTNINHYTACYTSASTAAKTASKSNFQLSTGAEIIVQFIYTNTASYPTLNINSTGAKSIYYNGTNILASALAANRVYKFVYDGSYWQLVGTLGYTKTSELTNDAGFLTSADVVDEVNLEDKPITSNAVYEYITEDEKVIASALNDLNTNKQDTLVSGTNIKTINNQSLLGEGNITISGGGSSGGDVNVIETVKVNGTALTPDSNKAVDISAVTSFNGSTGAVTYTAPVTSVNGATGAVTISIPTEVTESTVSGWGFTKNVGNITGVTGSNGLTGSGTSGNVTISHAVPSTSPAKTTSAVYPIKIDLYGHITEAGSAVTIPTLVTETTVSGWGFTKNNGTLTGVTFNGTSATITNGVAAISVTMPSEPGILNTNNSTAQQVVDNESFNGTINLHKVAKTGTYNDLIGTPTIPTVPSNVSAFTNDANYVTADNTVAIYSGSSAPSSSLGKNGDIYILTT